MSAVIGGSGRRRGDAAPGNRAGRLTRINALPARGPYAARRAEGVKAMDETIKRTILEVLDRHRITSVAKVRSDGWPQATTVGLSVYFLCGLGSQKARKRRPGHSKGLGHTDPVTG
ncbi:MAG: hypothetical protein ACHP7N_18240 [Caulobacterales bacterium]